jgi:sarcosine oxidase subunit beta
MYTTTDVAVVGGGVVGTAITYYLAKHGVKVCLLERSDIASGTSSAAANGVALQTKPPGPKQDLARTSVRLFHSLSEELDADIEYSNEGGMLVAETEDQLELVSDKAQKAAKTGLKIEVLSAKQTRSMQPCLAPHVVGAAYCSEDSTVNPYLLAFAFARAAKRLGATVNTYTEVTAVATSQGKVLTDTVVDAAGPWSPKLADMVGVKLPIEPRKGELFVTESVPPTVRGILISASYLQSKSLPADPASKSQMTAGVYTAQARRGNLVVGSTRQFAGYDRSTSYQGVETLLRQTAALIPTLAKLHVLRFYAGLRPSSPDGLPVLGRSPELPGFILAAGHEGDGIALSPITGKHIADLITGQITDAELAPFSPQRFRN